MRKLLLFAMMLTLGLGSASAQINIGNKIANAGKKAADKAAQKAADKMAAQRTAAKPADVVGTWKYEDAVIDLSGNTGVDDLAMVAATKKLNKPLNKQLETWGIKEGSVQFTFNDDKTFSAVIADKEISGTYSVSESGKLLKLTCQGVTIDGTAELEDDDLVILFDITKLESFLITATGKTGSFSAVTKVASALSHIDQINAGFKLDKE